MGDWDFYQRRTGDRPASILVDLSLFGYVPQVFRPWLVRVTLEMRSPRPDGLSSEAEYDELNAAEDALIPAIEATEAVYVGRVTSEGRRVFSFYTGDPASARAVVERMATSIGYPLTVNADHDPQWMHYAEEMHPSRADLQSILNRRVVENLRREGDDLTQPRPVDHVLYFTNRGDRERFRIAALDLGFKPLGNPIDNGRGERPFGLNVVRTDAVHPLRAIDGVVAELIASANAFGGTYDGWGCEIVK